LKGSSKKKRLQKLGGQKNVRSISGKGKLKTKPRRDLTEKKN